jgi:hypothetical protein
MNGIVNSIKNILGKAIDFITGLPNKAIQWGKDLMGGLKKGIESAKDAVGNAAETVAKNIASFLHFSVPDEGPLTEYESWMPDFMKGLAKGIESSRGLIQNAVTDVSKDMVVNPNVNGNTEAVTSGTNISSMMNGITEMIAGISNTQTGDIVIPVYIGESMLDEIVVNATNRNNLRSGGH